MMKPSRVMIFVAVGAFCTRGLGNDWPAWRGPEQTGMTREPAPVTTWSAAGENLVWKSPIGGRTTPIVMKGRLFTIAPLGEGLGLRERVVCLDADTGAVLWERAFNVFDSDVVENRVGWTAPVGDLETGNVYVHGTAGEFFCFDRDGTVLWKRSLTEEFGRISGYGGRLQTPIVDEGRVLISFLSSSWGEQAKPSHRTLALDKKTGQVFWWAAPGEAPFDTTYAAPVVAVIGGVRQLVSANADGNIYGMQARTGQKLWTFRLSKRGLNASVVVDGNYAYASHSEENLSGTVMGRVVCIDATKRGDLTETGEVWRADGCEVGYASPAVAHGRLYVVDNSATLVCLDARTGHHKWEYSLGRVGKGSPVVTADGVLYVGEQNGIFHILRDAGERCEPLDRDEFPSVGETVDELFGSPAIVEGRVYFMTRYGTYCLGSKEKKTVGVPIPDPPGEEKAAREVEGRVLMGRDSVSFHVIPAEVTLRPSEQSALTALGFADGQSVPGKFRADWTVKNVLGEVSPEGVFTVQSKPVFSAGEAIANFDQLFPSDAGGSKGIESRARIRVVPALPIVEDFESWPVDSTPAGWIGITRKTKIVERDGGKVLQKLAEDPSPPFLKIRGYFTPPLPGGYTVECDLLGTPKGDRFKPDMGVINTRYMVMLLGGDQALRIESWGVMPRVRHDVPYPWETGRWYRMKCRVEVSGEKATIRAKVWPREGSEPAAWTAEFVDPYPNVEGSAGLFGYSPGTTMKSKGPEVFFDNVRVSAND